MEGSIFKAPVVNRELKQMIEARLHTDARDPSLAAAHTALQERLLQKLGNPMFVVIDPVTEDVLGRLHKAEFNEEAFAEFLKTSRAKLSSTSP